MGAGASTVLPPSVERLDKEAVKLLAGSNYDDNAFEAHAIDGSVSREEYLAAAEVTQPMEGGDDEHALF